MNIQKIRIEDLIPAAYNPRKDLSASDPEYQKIRTSIATFGYVDPIIVNRDHTIIGGHQRIKVLRDRGYTEVDCIVVDIDKEHEKSLNIALNKISGEWDMELLKNLMAELDVLGWDMELTGFDLDEVEKLLTGFDGKEAQEDDFDVDKALEESEEPFTRRGDLWNIGKHRLLCGDSTEENDVTCLMGGKKADMVFTDPPWQKRSVAIVGSRKSTLYGTSVAQLTCTDYAIKRYKILSGLAKGIDAVVHRTALDMGAVTYGFLANGLNACYPKENRELMAEIIETGAVLSPFPAETPPIRQNFYSRNEIMVTWADDVIVAEAGEKSGALLTGKLALKNNRRLFVVPNSIFAPGSAGSNRLIQSGALPYLGTPEKIKSPSGNKTTLSPHADMIELLDITPLTTEELSRRLQRDPELILNDLLSLELEDMVRFHPDGKWHSNGH